MFLCQTSADLFMTGSAGALSLQPAESLADRLNATALDDHATQDCLWQATANGTAGLQAEAASPVSASSLLALFEEQHRLATAQLRRLLKPRSRFTCQ